LGRPEAEAGIFVEDERRYFVQPQLLKADVISRFVTASTLG